MKYCTVTFLGQIQGQFSGVSLFNLEGARKSAKMGTPANEVCWGEEEPRHTGVSTSGRNETCGSEF